MSNAVDVLIPHFGQGLDEALLTAVFVDAGAHVERGDALAEAETAKSTVEIVAEQAGVVTEFLLQKGAIVEAGEVLCHLRPDAA
ncbi:hypothetical protein GCM10027030_12620 [Luteococcus sediminum]|uniref:lipoyl domain-containing protein n=1 Tax=Luteococcus sp. TaxID=1969402 RepID=UPI003734CFAA